MSLFPGFSIEIHQCCIRIFIIIFFNAGSCYLAQVRLKRLTRLPQSLTFWGYQFMSNTCDKSVTQVVLGLSMCYSSQIFF